MLKPRSMGGVVSGHSLRFDLNYLTFPLFLSVYIANVSFKTDS